MLYNSRMENNEPLIEELNSRTQNQYKFMLKSATLDKAADFCVIEILYKDGVILTPELKQSFDEIILQILPKKYTYKINFVKNFISEERIDSETKTYLEKNFPSIYFKVKYVKLEDMTFDIGLVIDELSYAHAKQKNLNFEIQNYFKSLYEEYEFKCSYEQGEVFVEDQKELLKSNFSEEEPNMDEIRKIEISNVESLVGEPIEELPSYIKDKQSPQPLVVLSGKIKTFKDIVIKRKPRVKENEQVEEGEKTSESEKEPQPEQTETKAEESNENITEEVEAQNKYERKLFKWSLEDFTGSIPCVYFSNKETQTKLLTLADDTAIVVRGKIEEDKYNGGNSLIVQDISLCTLPEKFEEKIVYKKERPFYEFVEPEKVVTYTQNDLMNFMVEKPVPEFLKNKTFVCYDFETTGLHYERGDRIIEIGAVKIENGKITERFMSYVDPERKIPAESSAVSGITDADVVGAPKDYQVLQDFFKFTRNAIIIGYNNINFDNVFLIGQGKKCRWDFASNETDDVFRYAQKLVHGVKNYKLGTIAEKLGVVLDNAHRAVYDALATAEVFIKLAEMM